MNIRGLVYLPVFLTLLGALLWACGGDGDPTGGGSVSVPTLEAATDDGDRQGGSGGDVMVCELVSEDAVEAAVGESVTSSQSEDRGASVRCDYETATGTVVITVFMASSEATAQADYEAVSLGTEETVNGLGEQARWFPTYATLYVLTSVYGISVQITTSPLGVLDQARPLAEQVVAGLP
jgi:hypothetical protein